MENLNLLVVMPYCAQFSRCVVAIQRRFVHCGKFITTPKMGERKSACHCRDNPSFWNYSNLPQIGIGTVSDGKIGGEGWRSCIRLISILPLILMYSFQAFSARFCHQIHLYKLFRAVMKCRMRQCQNIPPTAGYGSRNMLPFLPTQIIW